MGKSGSGGFLKWTGTHANDTVSPASLNAFSHTIYDGSNGYDTLNLSGLESGVGLDVILGTGRGSGSSLWPTAFFGSWWTYHDNVASTPAITGTILNFEKIVGTNFNDFIELRGGSVARVVDGGGGDDAIFMSGSSGTSTAIGGAGSDQLFGGLNTDVLVGGTYDNGIVVRDSIRDEFELGAGTVLDFTPGVDSLYIDAGNNSAQTAAQSWVDIHTSFGDAAQLQVLTGRTITLVGVSAAQMNALPMGFAIGVGPGDIVSTHGDDLILDNVNAEANRFVMQSGSGHDELIGFDKGLDTLAVSGSITWSDTLYHGQQALLATYDDGNSSVLLVGLSTSDIGSVGVEFI